MILAHLLALFISIFPATPSQQPSSAEDSIAKIRLEWAKDLREKRLDEIVKLYTADAAFMSSDIGRVTGREAIRELCKNVMATLTSDLIFHSIHTEHSANLAYDTGDFSETLTKLADGSKTEDKGSYLMVFKRQADGSWLIAQQMWTGPPPAHK